MLYCRPGICPDYMSEAKNIYRENRAERSSSPRELFDLVRTVLPEAERLPALTTAHSGNSHSKHEHPHNHSGHAHEQRKGKRAASYKPDSLLSDGQRWLSLGKAALWLVPAGLFAVSDYLFHYITAAIPGTTDDVVLHGGAIIFLAKLANNLNAFYRGYEVPDSKISLRELGTNIKKAFTERKQSGGVMKGLSAAFSAFMPLEQYESYKGEGYPTSAVTYAAENLLGSYNEGVLGGAVKWLMSLGVIGGGIITKPVGTAFRYALSWLHEINEVDDGWHWGEKLLFFPVKLAGMAGGTIWYGLAGALDGTARYMGDLSKGIYYGSKREVN